jgi:hypothetical protein
MSLVNPNSETLWFEYVNLLPFKVCTFVVSLTRFNKCTNLKEDWFEEDIWISPEEVIVPITIILCYATLKYG